MKPLLEIEDLAESIAGQYMIDGQINLENIAQDKKISIIYGNYQGYFLGQLVHDDGEFYIHVNLDRLEANAPRTRFTIAHDIGHYFIDYQRNLLRKGISLTYNGVDPKPLYEIEADHFASHLLMPKTLFRELARKQDPGIDAVLYLKNYFNTSIECTAIHYAKLNILPCMVIRWAADITKKYVFCSESLISSAVLTKRPSIKFQKDAIRKSFMEIEFSDPKVEYIENVTSLSKWVATIAPGSQNDLLGIEQTFKLGDFGGLTFLLF